MTFNWYMYMTDITDQYSLSWEQSYIIHQLICRSHPVGIEKMHLQVCQLKIKRKIRNSYVHVFQEPLRSVLTCNRHIWAFMFSNIWCHLLQQKCFYTLRKYKYCNQDIHNLKQKLNQYIHNVKYNIILYLLLNIINTWPSPKNTW